LNFKIDEARSWLNVECEYSPTSPLPREVNEKCRERSEETLKKLSQNYFFISTSFHVQPPVVKRA
jgi:hypothetical protein